jgi:hypothetical protein
MTHSLDSGRLVLLMLVEELDSRTVEKDLLRQAAGFGEGGRGMYRIAHVSRRKTFS